MRYVDVRTQAALDAALMRAHAETDLIVRCVGDGRFDLRGASRAVLRDSSSAVLWDSSSAELRDSSSAVLWESSRAVLWDSSSAELRGASSAELRGSSRAVLWESSRAVLWDSSSAELRGASSAELRGSGAVAAGAYCALQVRPEATSPITGGVVIRLPAINTPDLWCDYYGVATPDGVAVLFKAVDDNYRSNHNRFPYVPGSVPVAPDWDDGFVECGGGLHFSPSPRHARRFNPDATRYVACPVALADIVVHYPAQYPDKIKARGCCAPVWECDIDGQPIRATATP